MEKKRQWSFVTYGTSVDTKHNGCSGSPEDNTLSLWSVNGKGKLVPASTDGLAFYYTVLDPETENFTISADITVKSWTFSNGQDGFGVMVSDSVGVNGREDSFWNNSYMAAVTGYEYCYDRELLQASSTGVRYSMKLGVCAMEKKGLTNQVIEEGNPAAVLETSTFPLETVAGEKGLAEGCYNLVGAYTNGAGILQDIETCTTFHLSVKRDNNGYEIGYRDEQGREHKKRFYREAAQDELTRLDKDRIYAGFFAARNAEIAVRNVVVDTLLPKEDAPFEEPPVSYVTPVLEAESAQTANQRDYELVFYGNTDGSLAFWQKTEQEGLVREQGGLSVKAFQKLKVPVKLLPGENVFEICFRPDEAYRPSKYEKIKPLGEISFPFCVRFFAGEGAPEEVYIAPEGRPEGAGTREEPVDIYTALERALPGQKLLLLGGRYLLTKPLSIARGMNGTPKKPIRLQAAEEAEERPVFDFCRKSQGFSIAGNYWYFKNFDVTGTGPGCVGIRLGGSFNVLERLYIYGNGNTGLQISRYRKNDTREEWPAHNHILNCTAYLNADPGYTDSDGFAAKLTAGEGNMFEGCISAYNADDGFDLFAKVETGSIGRVEIKGCLAFRNGYVLDKRGREIHVGLGNGFKLGGSSLSGRHILKNSIAFLNGEKGIDANSCPDAEVYDCLSFENDSHNVALFTTDARNTDFCVRGVLSLRRGKGLPDKLELRGTQDPGKVYGEDNFYFDGAESVNSAGEKRNGSLFQSLDADRAAHGGICRRADGSIERNGFLEKKQKNM